LKQAVAVACEDPFPEGHAIEESLVNQFLSKRNLLALAVLLIGILLLAFLGPRSGQVSESGSLTSIRSIETLRSQFNQDEGKTRLILLLSPT